MSQSLCEIVFPTSILSPNNKASMQHFSLKAFEVRSVKVVRLESPLFFGNAERFREALIDATGVDPSSQQEAPKLGNDGEKHDLLKNKSGGNSYGGIPGVVS